MRLTTGCLALIALSTLAPLLTACAGASAPVEGLDAAALPREVRADYAIFAQRCSKCHSLARPLNSGITDESYWSLYVARMRRQPASGISKEDTAPILRFLHYYALDELRKKERPSPTPDGSTPEPTSEPASSASSSPSAPPTMTGP